uniref:Uncharacterized protein n=1 Tax=Timema genevievae TaxID=629358 RepID=A0A7R9PR98_TIMGE|nr:unnamed protein product [Timema genevievae]
MFPRFSSLRARSADLCDAVDLHGVWLLSTAHLACVGYRSSPTPLVNKLAIGRDSERTSTHTPRKCTEITERPVAECILRQRQLQPISLYYNTTRPQTTSRAGRASVIMPHEIPTRAGRASVIMPHEIPTRAGRASVIMPHEIPTRAGRASVIMPHEIPIQSVQEVCKISFEKPGRRPDFDYPQMAKEAVLKALDDAKLHHTDVQQACVGYVYGRT